MKAHQLTLVAVVVSLTISCASFGYQRSPLRGRVDLSSFGSLSEDIQTSDVEASFFNDGRLKILGKRSLLVNYGFIPHGDYAELPFVEAESRRLVAFPFFTAQVFRGEQDTIYREPEHTIIRNHEIVFDIDTGESVPSGAYDWPFSFAGKRITRNTKITWGDTIYYHPGTPNIELVEELLPGQRSGSGIPFHVLTNARTIELANLDLAVFIGFEFTGDYARFVYLKFGSPEQLLRNLRSHVAEVLQSSPPQAAIAEVEASYEARDALREYAETVRDVTRKYLSYAQRVTEDRQNARRESVLNALNAGAGAVTASIEFLAENRDEIANVLSSVRNTHIPGDSFGDVTEASSDPGEPEPPKQLIDFGEWSVLYAGPDGAMGTINSESVTDSYSILTQSGAVYTISIEPLPQEAKEGILQRGYAVPPDPNFSLTIRHENGQGLSYQGGGTPRIKFTNNSDVDHWITLTISSTGPGYYYVVAEEFGERGFGQEDDG